MIIFLDFDGVLHPLQRSEPDFCRLELLWKILRACPNVEVVFSTSWREIYSPDEIIEFVTLDGGEDLVHRFIGSTPLLVREEGAFITVPYHRRHIECRLWLIGNKQQHRQWLALDDIAVTFPQASPTLYLVDGKTGLTEVDVEKIIDKLTQGRNQFMNDGEKYCQLTGVQREGQLAIEPNISPDKLTELQKPIINH